jgi:hypothetical protein
VQSAMVQLNRRTEKGWQPIPQDRCVEGRTGSGRNVRGTVTTMCPGPVFIYPF